MSKGSTFLFLVLCFPLLTLVTTGAAGEASAQPSIYKKVDPSVVVIRQETSLGSGFIISKEGHILTNGHVVTARDPDDPKKPAKSITVLLHDETKYQADVIGFCLNPDVALLKIKTDRELIPVTLGDSKKVSIGQRCFAAGAPRGLKRTYTSGILSNVSRTDLGTFTSVLQTDAAINPGNSGGPLFDETGQVLGLNTYGGGGNNLGFTIPIHVAIVLKDHFLKYGYFKRAALPDFHYGELYDELIKGFGVEKGIFIHQVTPGSKAATAGLKDEDIIVAMNGKPVTGRTLSEVLEFKWKLATSEIGQKVTFTIKRGRNPNENGPSKEVRVTGVLEEDEPQPMHGHQSGEIKFLYYDTLGLRFRRKVHLDSVLYRLPETPGVLVWTIEQNSPAAKAGLRTADIITAVEGVATPDVETFQTELEKNLLACKKAIVLSLRKRNVMETTALAPYYDLKRKKVALVAADTDVDDLGTIRRSLISSGAQITFATPSGAAPKEKGFNIVKVSKLNALNIDEFDAVLFLGGKGAIQLWTNKDALQLVKEGYDKKKVLAAVGSASILLIHGHEDILKLKITTAKGTEFSKVMTAKKANYTGKDVEKEGKVVTTTGFDLKVLRAFMKAFRILARK